MGINVLLDLTGGVALLLWGLHMVHSGIVRAFGSGIRRVLGNVLRHRLLAFAAGIGVTTVLQSSTATALMLASFSASGLLELVPALAVMLGANIGTTLIVQLLSFNATAAAPVLLAAGVIAFKRSSSSRARDLGRVAIGLGLMLLSLHLLLDSLAPAEDAPLMRELFGMLAGAPVLALLIGAVLAWVSHSSVATVLLTASLAWSAFVDMPTAFALVLGANLGSAVNPLLQGIAGGNPAHRRLPLGNFANRAIGCAIFLPLLEPLATAAHAFHLSTITQVAGFHTLFNVATALLFIGLLGPVARLLEHLLPDDDAANDPSAPRHLDERVLESPPLALACAARETLHMGDIVEDMLRQSMNVLLTNDRRLATEVSRRDNAADRLHEAIKLYTVKLTRDSLDEAEGQRAMEIMALAINLEHIGDIIDKNLMELAAKKIKRQLQFSVEGAAELEAFHAIVIDNLRLAFGVFMTGDARAAKQLLAEKARMRELEMTASENHLARLREGRPESIETSSLHLDVLRDLKRIHSHICATAYPALEAAGELPVRRPMLAPAVAASEVRFEAARGSARE